VELERPRAFGEDNPVVREVEVGFVPLDVKALAASDERTSAVLFEYFTI